jgi:uncharacterized protein YaaW (UPF0174 family)
VESKEFKVMPGKDVCKFWKEISSQNEVIELKRNGDGIGIILRKE